MCHCSKKIFLFPLYLVFVFLVIVHITQVQAAEVKFAWTPNTEPSLAGYKIYWGLDSRNYADFEDVGNPTPVEGEMRATLSGFTPGITYYFAAVAYDVNGFESDYSVEVVWTAPEETSPPPTAENGIWSLAEDTVVSGQLNGKSEAGLPLSYEIVTDGSLGSAIILDADSGTFRYTPAKDSSGVDSFTYKVRDANGESMPATVRVIVYPVNDVPVAEDGQISSSENVQLTGTLAASDADEDALTYALVSDGSLGHVEITDPETGQFTYTPQADISGLDSFTFKVSDGLEESNVATISIEIVAVNEAPHAEDAVLSVTENGRATGVLLGSDRESTTLSYSIVSAPRHGQVTILDSWEGIYVYEPSAGAVGLDSFSFIVTDEMGADSNTATVTVSIAPEREIPAMEIGEVTLNARWSRVDFTEPFTDPVVVVKPASYNDENPCVVRIRNVTSDGFDVRLQNWNYLPANHAAETVGFIVIERGTHVLADGTMVEADLIETNEVNRFVSIDFSNGFNVVPVVAASIVTYNGGAAVDGRIRNVTASGFKYTMQEQEANDDVHVFETVAYIAWEPSSGTTGDLAYQIGMSEDTVTSDWHSLSFPQPFPEAPVFIADMQSRNGGDTANLRYTDLSGNGVRVKVSEEQSKDVETRHIGETVGFMAFSPLKDDPDRDGLTTAEEKDLYGTDPMAADSDGDGLDDGEELDYWGNSWQLDIDGDGLINLMDNDADDDGYGDGAELLRLTDPANPISYPDDFTWEAGMVDVTGTWQQVFAAKKYADPVVVAKALIADEHEPAVIRIRNVQPGGFEIMSQEWDYLDGVHGKVRVGYMIMERGSYLLADGTRVEAGRFSTDAASTYATLRFQKEFGEIPVVTSSVASMNEKDAVIGRVRDIGLTQFRFKMQEQELNERLHAPETISYIAWEPSRGMINGISFEVGKTDESVTNNPADVILSGNFAEAPVVLADIQTANGGDTASARIDYSLPDSFTVWVEEERSRDDEINHIAEAVGYIAIGR